MSSICNNFRKALEKEWTKVPPPPKTYGPYNELWTKGYQGLSYKKKKKNYYNISFTILIIIRFFSINVFFLKSMLKALELCLT
jgi:hypothetical protein